MNTQDVENIVKKFSTYSDYLDSMITKDDLMFLQDKEMCRDLLLLGYHTNKRIMPEEDFNRRKQELAKSVAKMRVKEIKLYSQNELCQELLMQELAKREEDNLMGRVATILFLRDVNSRGEEVSSYIDFSHRLTVDTCWDGYFSGKRKLAPLPSDLSFYNWIKEESSYNSSPNFEVVPNKESLKLCFVCKADGKSLEVNRKEGTEDCYREDLNVTKYLQAVLFDHVVDAVVS